MGSEVEGLGLKKFFFFQAEDGIRDYKVTGVQTCALPIFLAGGIELNPITCAPTLFLRPEQFSSCRGCCLPVLTKLCHAVIPSAAIDLSWLCMEDLALSR